MYELQIFMQLYYPDKFCVDKILVMVEGVYYKLSLPQGEFEYKENYYKKQQIGNIRTTFVTYSIKKHYTLDNNLSEEQIENYAQEIIYLRNHYVHSGYFIKNSCLRVSFEKINGKKNPRDYTVTNVDVYWIYERTKILYRIVIDIIFHNMLGYSDYNNKRHF